MADPQNTRRHFLKTTSAQVAGAALSPLAAGAGEADASKTLNYHPKMGYRPLGRTGFMISEVSLGGHGAVGPDQVQNRVTVLEKAVESGINYVDNNIAAECDLYGEAMAKSAGARRDRWFIGFASWPQKITTEWEENLSEEGMMRSIEDRLRSYRTDVLDMWRPVGATWGEGQTKIATMLMVSHKALDLVVKVFEKAKEQGKVRFLAVSAHNPQVFRRVLNEYPQFSVIIFPYLFLTKEFGGDSLLKLAQEKNVGVIGLKPFGAGMTFGARPRKDVEGRVDRGAHRLVKRMLQEPRLSAVIPGINSPEQLEENVQGSYQRHAPSTAEDEAAVRRAAQSFYANLRHTPEYRWLRQWEVV